MREYDEGRRQLLKLLLFAPVGLSLSCGKRGYAGAVPCQAVPRRHGLSKRDQTREAASGRTRDASEPGKTDIQPHGDKVYDDRAAAGR